MALVDRPLLLFVLAVVVLRAVLGLGSRLGARTEGRDPKRAEQVRATRDEVALLLSVLLGFTLAAASTRFDRRKQLLVDEAVSLGTTTLRATLLPEPARAEARRLLGDYVDERVAFARAGTAWNAEDPHAKRLQERLWRVAERVAEDDPTPITALFVASLNETLDLNDQRLASLENRIPGNLWVMLGVLALLTAFMFGLGVKRQVAGSMIVPPLIIAVVLTLIADLDTPNHGPTQLDRRSLERLQHALHAPDSR